MTQSKNTHGNITIAIDSTGIKVTNSGDSIRYKHGTPRRGFIKLHGTVDTKTMTVTGMIITDESSHDSKHLIDLAEESGKRNTVSCVLADDTYDAAIIFEHMYHERIRRVIPVRKNSRCDTPSYPRTMTAKMQRCNTEWKKTAGSGKRWVG